MQLCKWLNPKSCLSQNIDSRNICYQLHHDPTTKRMKIAQTMLSYISLANRFQMMEY